MISLIKGPLSKSAFRLLLCVSIALSFVSCMSAPTRSRGSLSGAMDKARDDYEGDRSVPDKPRERDRDTIIWPTRDDRDDRYDRDDDYDDSGSEYDSSSTSSASTPSGPWWLSVRMAKSHKPSSHLQAGFDGDILIGAQLDDNSEINVYGGLMLLSPVDGSDLDASLRDPLGLLRFGLEYRYVPFAGLSFMSPYVSLGLGGYVMMWSYENSLPSGWADVSGDSLEGVILSAGLGLYPVKTDQFRVGVSLTAEAYVFALMTNQGFDNDVFPAYGAVKLACEITPLIFRP